MCAQVPRQLWTGDNWVRRSLSSRCSYSVVCLPACGPAILPSKCLDTEGSCSSAGYVAGHLQGLAESDSHSVHSLPISFTEGNE